MKIAVVGGGMLGLTLGYRLARRQHRVTILESGDQVGGLAAPADYGRFTWDRFYHCILPQDAHLLALINDLGLQSQLRWKTTETGYFAQGEFYNMSSTADFLRFPLLSLPDKGRLGMLIQYARWGADPQSLFGITAKDWLIRWCGRRAYTTFWQPLLKSKFGPLHDQVAATFIWATVTRLFGARSGGTNREQLGYVNGGYRRILGALESKLQEHGARLLLRTTVHEIGSTRLENGSIVGDVTYETCERHVEGRRRECFDQVFFTAATPLARRAVTAELLPHVEQMQQDYPTSAAYLGIACAVLVLAKPLMPYYVLNIGDDPSVITGVVEMTNLIDKDVECDGCSLVYVPRYAASDDPLLDRSDEDVYDNVVQYGLRTIFPGLQPQDIVEHFVHRARFVQALPLVRDRVESPKDLPTLASPLQILNSSMLKCATLNNNEIVGLVDAFLRQRGESLEAINATPKVAT